MLPILPELVDGPVSLGTKVESASPTAHFSKTFQRPKRWETTKGAGVCERGDPLILIISQK